MQWDCKIKEVFISFVQGEAWTDSHFGSNLCVFLVANVAVTSKCGWSSDVVAPLGPRKGEILVIDLSVSPLRTFELTSGFPPQLLASASVPLVVTPEYSTVLTITTTTTTLLIV
jgi:hypothetical protein